MVPRPPRTRRMPARHHRTPPRRPPRRTCRPPRRTSASPGNRARTRPAIAEDEGLSCSLLPRGEISRNVPFSSSRSGILTLYDWVLVSACVGKHRVISIFILECRDYCYWSAGAGAGQRGVRISSSWFGICFLGVRGQKKSQQASSVGWNHERISHVSLLGTKRPKHTSGRLLWRR